MLETPFKLVAKRLCPYCPMLVEYMGSLHDRALFHEKVGLADVAIVRHGLMPCMGGVGV